MNHENPASFFEDSKSTGYKWAEDDDQETLLPSVQSHATGGDERTQDRLDRIRWVSELMDGMKPNERSRSVLSDPEINHIDRMPVPRSSASSPPHSLSRLHMNSSTPNGQEDTSFLQSPPHQTVTNITSPSVTPSRAYNFNDKLTRPLTSHPQDLTRSREISEPVSWTSSQLRFHVDEFLHLDGGRQNDHRDLIVDQNIPDNRNENLTPAQNAEHRSSNSSKPVGEVADHETLHSSLIEMKAEHERHGQLLEKIINASKELPSDRSGFQDALEHSLRRAKAAEIEFGDAQRQVERMKQSKQKSVDNRNIQKNRPDGLSQNKIPSRNEFVTKHLESPIMMNTNMKSRNNKTEPLGNASRQVNTSTKTDDPASEEELRRKVDELKASLSRAQDELRAHSIQGCHHGDHAKALTPQMMPDAERIDIETEDKMYYRLQLYEVDFLCSNEIANILKNVLIQLDTPFRALRQSVVDNGDKLVDLRQLRDFAEDVHHTLYQGDLMEDGPVDEDCLALMLSRVGKLSRAAERRRSRRGAS